MVTTLKFVQDNTKEGIEWELKNAKTDQAIDISVSEINELTARIYSQDNATLICSGTKTNGEVTYISDGTDGKCKFTPSAGDFATIGNFRAELHVEFADNSDLRVHDLVIVIVKKAPVS